MAICALVVPEPIPHRSDSAAQALFAVTGGTLELAVSTLERIRGQLRVVERLELERFHNVARVALTLGRSKTKLPGVNVTVATRALTRRSAVRSPFSAQPVSFRGSVTTIAGGFRMSAGQRPGAVIDPW